MNHAGFSLRSCSRAAAPNRIRPEYQVGLRSTLIPERLLVDLSWGGHTAAGFAGAGWALGFAWTPPPFF